ncbi:hypothetical protein [Pseudonocardia ammonioxydans]|uniref:hypothetical protein n=1 Tax=Pseudonocardia ammonioxydans TaxID=260086 RepID=UPI0015A6D6C8|nr:hypothetical protein [Pseudonocardia ammonioxydans]
MAIRPVPAPRPPSGRPRQRGLADLISVAALAQPSLHVAGAWATTLIPVSGSAAAHHAVPPRTSGIQVVLSVFIVLAVLACGRVAADLSGFLIARRSSTEQTARCGSARSAGT